MASYSSLELLSIQRAYEEMLADINPSVNAPEHLALIDKAFRYCLEKYDGCYLPSGKAYMFHLIDMARIAVVEVGLGYISVVAAFLHGIDYKNDVSIKELQDQFGRTVAIVLEDFSQISKLDTEKVAYNSDNFQVMFLSLIDDMRAVLLKIVHRVYDVRNQNDVLPDRLAKYFHEIKYIYIPIVHRLGLYKLKAELEEKLMLYENPAMFQEIKAKIEATHEARKKTAEDFISRISESIDAELERTKKNGKHKYAYSVKWRLKSIPSIYAKMKAQNVPFEEVYDLMAARVIIRCALKDEQECCWSVYSAITNLFEPMPERLRDWITKPKASGYESLHTTVKYDDKLWFEVQIRTTRMDDIAETGQAAHYLYKGEKETSEEWLLNVREVLENPGLVSFENSYKKIYKSDKIFIFTPEGDLKQLPLGSTVLDFAYEIHTRVGETCNGARVNGRMVPIRHELNNGDRVEVITSKKQSPRADWLNVVVTEKAKNKIRRYLKEEELKESEMGKGLLQRRLKNWKLPFSETVVDMLVREFKLENSLQLYHQISTEKIDITDVKHFLTIKFGEMAEKAERPAPEQIESNKKDGGQSEMEESLSIGEDIDHVTYKLAKCCNPIPGDRVFGFVTSDGTISIHRTNCPNAKGLQQRYGYRIIKVKWNGMESNVSQATISIHGHDVMGLLGRITKIISEDLQVNMKNIMFNTDKEGFFQGKIVLQIADVAALEQLMDKIKSVEGIIDVIRID
ncbi:MAG: bifunctional (p)ppGpp synthetase/guanosine-3',5'-bis(diphosphate) 3'-pyrophosphohydrolase [Bacteroidales bacterium]|nr:bifunctional (p)ppGpp synthetase/guanosine-3',5'-bis(diphosphate) 3'-pyrophosphohydrolase [Bacteroidales bacterium]